MKTPLPLAFHDTLLKLLHDRSEYVDKWLDHVKADPEMHSIVQLPVPGKPLYSMYVLIEKSKKDACTQEYLASCPTLLVQQSVSTNSPIHPYRPIKTMRRN